MSARELITEHLDLWTGAVTKKSSSGRGSNSKVELTGVKKLRELILELAVRGKLVVQNPTDEPARELLERVKAEKVKLVKQGELKKRRKLPKLLEMSTPFHLPSSWEWAQLEDVGRDWGQKAPTNGFSYIDVASIDNLRGVTTEPSILSADEAPSRARKIVHEGTLIYSTIRPYLQNIAVVENEIKPEPIASTAFAILHPLAEMPARFFLHYLRSPVFVKYVESVQTGIAYPAINDKQFFSGLVPVPPLKEQHRIVQKVDELMALCDKLEQQTSDQIEAHDTLVDTLLGTLTQSENATELADNWARLAAHFDTLFTTEKSIDKLKQTILQLAVMGRLVKQNAGDKSAGDLIQSIENKKAELIESGVIKRSKLLSPVPQEYHPFRLPNGWGCHRLGGLVSKLGSGSTPRGGQRAYVDDGIPFLRSQNVWNDGLRLEDVVYISEDTHARMSNTVVYPRDILLNITGASLGRSTVFPDPIPEANVSQHVTIIRLIEPAMTPFVHLCIQSPLIQKFVWGRQVGMAIEGLSKKVLERFEMPIPPLEEQGRIVEKVDELMTLCDQLKEHLTQASDTRCQLAEAIVEQELSACYAN